MMQNLQIIKNLHKTHRIIYFFNMYSLFPRSIPRSIFLCERIEFEGNILTVEIDL